MRVIEVLGLLCKDSCRESPDRSKQLAEAIETNLVTIRGNIDPLKRLLRNDLGSRRLGGVKTRQQQMKNTSRMHQAIVTTYLSEWNTVT